MASAGRRRRFHGRKHYKELLGQATGACVQTKGGKRAQPPGTCPKIWFNIFHAHILWFASLTHIGPHNVLLLPEIGLLRFVGKNVKT